MTHDMRPPSAGQLKVIGFIEENLKIKFSGTSVTDARMWIGQHMEESQVVGARNRETNLSLIAQIGRQLDHRARVDAYYAEQRSLCEAEYQRPELPKYTPDGYEIEYGFGGMVMGFLPKEPDVGDWS